MLRFLRSLLLLLASILVLGTPAVARPARPAPVAHPALWKVSDADTTIWLFGTIHALPPGIHWLDGKVARAFDSSSELVTEILEAKPEQMQQLVMTNAMLPPERTLRGLLNSDELSAYEAAMARLSLPVAQFDRFKPWFAAVALATAPAMRDGYGRENGVEEILNARARTLGRPHSALETPDYQLMLFDSLSEPEQRRYLSEVVKELPSMRNQLSAMVEAWKRGNADELARLMNDGEDDPALMEKLLINRNRNWASWITERMKQPGTVFVAVGAGHLAGTGSVQDQLAAAGIRTTRVQ